MLINRDRSILFVIDVQERLIPAIHQGGDVIEGALMLIEAARRLSIPVRCSEQYPKGLGPTVPALREQLAENEIFSKTAFSCAEDAEIARSVGETRRRQLILCGVESHVCVLQTAIGFQTHGYDVFVVADAVSSRAPDSVDSAKARLLAAGVHVVTREMVFFEWLGAAGTPEFKELRHLV